MQQMVAKHTLLRTSFHINTITNQWYQQIEEINDEGFTFVESDISMISHPEALDKLIAQEMAPGLFTLEGARRVRLHIVHRISTGDHQEERSSTSEDVLQVGDAIIINVRHEAIDGTSIRYFLDELAQAYKTGQLPVQSDAMTYLDYTVYERQVDKSASFAYWKEHLRNLDNSKFMMRFPYDRP